MMAIMLLEGPAHGRHDLQSKQACLQARLWSSSLPCLLVCFTIHPHMQCAKLYHSHMQWAKLYHSHMQWAKLYHSYMQWAGLECCDILMQSPCLTTLSSCVVLAWAVAADCQAHPLAADCQALSLTLTQLPLALTQHSHSAVAADCQAHPLAADCQALSLTLTQLSLTLTHTLTQLCCS